MQEHYWKFINNDGSFIWTNPDPVHKLYFPLCNELGFMSAITPRLHGDIKSGQHSFLTPPVSINDINNTKSARNFWFYVDGYGPISVSGNSKQEQIENMARPDEADVTIEGGLLFHKLSRMHHRTALKLEVLSFVPTDHNLEVMMISVENCSNSPVSLVPTSAIPLYARSAENLRDHRHVTSLVNRTKISEKGLEVHPEILFDERGHKYNDKIYYVYGAEGDGSLPEGTLGDLNAFIGQHGDLEWPEYIVQNKSFPETQDSDGKETLAAIRFQPIVLLPGQIRRYILLMGIDCSYEQIQNSYIKLNTYEKIMTALEKNNAFWQNEANKVAFRSGVKDFDHWMKWVEIQPIFRKIYGNSFLPHHDYGKGGRGWRDLWQDLLSIILLRPEESKDHLINNYGGIRLDGTNATIIGSQPGEFIADRNNISRVWMDHGTWPFLTTLLYMHQSGDTEILFSKNTYFRDPQIKRASDRDLSWTESYGNKQRTLAGEIYEGSLLEHILVQHYTSFYNVGTHNIILLEGADWNDTLDMANNHGESVPFTALYGRNMVQLADVLETMKSTNGIETVELFSALDRLIQPGDYESITEKKARLDAYYQAIYYSFTGAREAISIETLIRDLRDKGNWILNHIRNEEFLEKDQEGFFNGYYNDDQLRVDGFHNDAVRINLTGQVFPIMSGAATQKQVTQVHAAVKKYLRDVSTGGYKLNTNLGPNKLNFGRGFAFKYGEKENGAIFSHMVVMYMNALYKSGFISEAYEVFTSIYDLATNRTNEIYPGIPEYFNLEGKGLYHYLTGSASWLFLTTVTEIYGVKGEYGDLLLQPKLVPDQFDGDKSSIKTTFAGRLLEVIYLNPMKKAPEHFEISSVMMNGNTCACHISSKSVIVKRSVLEQFSSDETIRIEVVL